MWWEIKRFVERKLLPVLVRYKFQLNISFLFSYLFFLYSFWWFKFHFIPSFFSSSELILIIIIFSLLGVVIATAITALSISFWTYTLCNFAIQSFLKIKIPSLLVFFLTTFLNTLLFPLILNLLYELYEKNKEKLEKFIIIPLILFDIGLLTLTYLSSEKNILQAKEFDWYVISLFSITVFTIIIVLFFLHQEVEKLSHPIFREKEFSLNLNLLAAQLAYIGFILFKTIFAPSMGMFIYANLYLKGEYCYFLQEKGFIKKTDIHKTLVNNTGTSNMWCELKNAYIFWKDSQNIYVHITKDEYEYNLPIKREFILQEPLTVKKVFKPKKETQQNKSTTKGENKNISQKVQPQNKTDS